VIKIEWFSFLVKRSSLLPSERQVESVVRLDAWTWSSWKQQPAPAVLSELLNPFFCRSKYSAHRLYVYRNSYLYQLHSY